LGYLAFEVPLIFRTEADQARAIAHIERLLGQAEAAFDAADDDMRNAIAGLLASTYNYQAALFSTRNMRPFAARIGRLLEHHLKHQGFALDHDFPARSGKQRVGVIVRNIERRTESFI